jgi:hypothetical protein
MTEFFGENHSSRDDWTRQRAAARFIDAGNTREPGGAKLFLVTKSAAPIGHPQKLSADCADFHRKFLRKAAFSMEICVNLRNLWTKQFALLPYRRGFLAFAGAEIIQSGATNAAFLLHLYFCDARRVQWEHALHAFTVRDAADGKCFVKSAPLAANHDTGEYLDSLLISLHNPRMDTDGVAHLECVRVGFLLLFLDGIDDLIHKLRFIDSWRPRGCGRTLLFEGVEFAT